MVAISFYLYGLGYFEIFFCEMLAEFYSRGKLNKETNTTFLTLVPKVPNPMELREFKPISFVGCACKLLANILANRLKVAFPFIISAF